MSKRLFQYRAIDSRGKTMEGSMEAQSPEEVGTWLTERQYYVVDIHQSTLGTLASIPRIRSIPRPELNYFLIQLSSLIEAGCPLLLSLQALHRQLSPGPLKSLVKDLKEKIEVGKSFSEALKSYPDVFSQLFITLVEVGEIGGILSEVLDRYAKIHDAMYRIRSKVIKSMIYPALLLTLTIVFTWVLLVWVFPTFIEKFQEGGIPLPLPTHILLTVSNFLRHNWLALGFGVVALWQAFRLFRQSKPGGQFLG
ncbi:MAG TPA: type II secretion system F family protein, partial [Candidatus Ozemobacteraceae bacterium]|nr:type II secretion system F family protein [Candidatus Ozemobacteraceae bacterium]